MWVKDQSLHLAVDISGRITCAEQRLKEIISAAEEQRLVLVAFRGVIYMGLLNKNKDNGPNAVTFIFQGENLLNSSSKLNLRITVVADDSKGQADRKSVV